MESQDILSHQNNLEKNKLEALHFLIAKFPETGIQTNRKNTELGYKHCTHVKWLSTKPENRK